MSTPSPHVISTAAILKACPEVSRRQLKRTVADHLDLVVYRSRTLWLSSEKLKERFPDWYSRATALLTEVSP